MQGGGQAIEITGGNKVSPVERHLRPGSENSFLVTFPPPLFFFFRMELTLVDF